MSNSVEKLIIRQELSLRDALKVIDHNGSGKVLVVDDDGVLVGVATDGDIRRALLRDRTLETPIHEVMNRDFLWLPHTASTDEINSSFRKSIRFIPLIDEDGKPVDLATTKRPHRIPILEPLLDGNELDYLTDCVATNWISSQGRYVKEFEGRFEQLHSGMHAVAVSNGTAALSLALQAVGIGAGDEVIVPDLTFAACGNAVIHAGATPVFVDIESDSWTIDPRSVEANITARTRAIMPVHLYGNACDMDTLKTIAARHRLLVLEDCAEALGTKLKGMPVGTFGDAATFSFFGNKTISTGEGGMILFRDPGHANHARLLRDHGMSPERRYWHEVVGFNFRLTNMQAAIGVAQLERLELFVEKKRELAKCYTEILGELEGVVLPNRDVNVFHSYWLYSILFPSHSVRDAVAAFLAHEGIETRPLFHPMHTMPAFAEYPARQPLPISCDVSGRGLSLPSAVTLSLDDAASIANLIKDQYSAAAS